MGFVDLIAGVSFVAGHVGLMKLDRGLRDGLNIPMEQIQANVQLVTRSAQITTLTNQIQQLRGQAAQVQKQQLNALHAQLMVQISQLQLQVQQLSVERQRWEMEVRKEYRLAQENHVLRIFADLYDQARTYLQQGYYLDFLFVTLAVLRLYRQLYNDLDDANNRLKVSDLKGQLYEQARQVLAEPRNRAALAQAYAQILRTPMDLTSRHQRCAQAVDQALTTTMALRVAPPDRDWQRSTTLIEQTQGQLDGLQRDLQAVRQELVNFTGGEDPRELFFAAQPDVAPTFFPNLSAAWDEWQRATSANLGIHPWDVYQGLSTGPSDCDAQLTRLVQSRQELLQLSQAHRTGQVVAFWEQAGPVYQRRFQENRQRFAGLAGAAPTGPEALLERCMTLRVLHYTCYNEFLGLRKYSAANQFANTKQYQAASLQRLQGLRATAEYAAYHVVSDMFSLAQQSQALEDQIKTQVARDQAALEKQIQDDGVYQNLVAYLKRQLTAAEVQEIENNLGQYQPGKVKALLQGERGKEVDRRKKVLALALELYPPSRVQLDPNLPRLNQPPLLPAPTR